MQSDGVAFFTSPGTNYRNLGCAECSARPTNQTTFRRALANGWCEALDPLSLVERGRPVVHNCSRPYNNESTAYPFVIAGRPARTLGYAELADGCANGPADPVCASGSNYYNMWCAICSDHDIADVSRNPCSRLNRTINETCPDTARTLPGALGCLFSGYNPVCGADGQTYKNAGCATCNGLLQPDMSRGACSTDDEVFDLCAATSTSYLDYHLAFGSLPPCTRRAMFAICTHAYRMPLCAYNLTVWPFPPMHAWYSRRQARTWLARPTPLARC